MSYLFHGQRSNEDVVLVAKQHPMIILDAMLGSALILLIPFLAYVYLPVGAALGVITFGSLFIGLGHGFLAWYAWHNSVMMLTTERVVMLHQKGLLNQEFSECGLSNIQQVSHEIKGLYRTIFGFGTIIIYTGGAQTPLDIPNVPNPYEIQQEILRAASKGEFVEDDVKNSQ